MIVTCNLPVRYNHMRLVGMQIFHVVDIGLENVLSRVEDTLNEVHTKGWCLANTKVAYYRATETIYRSAVVTGDLYVLH